jgi:hypothetical protein
VEHVENVMTRRGFDLTLGIYTPKELGIVLDFWIKEITLNVISLQMRDINKLETRATVKRTWTMNNNIYPSMSKES